MDAAQAVEEMFAETRPDDMLLRQVDQHGDRLRVVFDAINSGEYPGPLKHRVRCDVQMTAPLSDTDPEVRAWPADSVREWAYYGVYVRTMELFWTSRLLLEGTWALDGTLEYVIPAAASRA
jgi:hypothetical protein